jgi:hypothetical protein
LTISQKCGLEIGSEQNFLLDTVFFDHHQIKYIFVFLSLKSLTNCISSIENTFTNSLNLLFFTRKNFYKFTQSRIWSIIIVVQNSSKALWLLWSATIFFYRALMHLIFWVWVHMITFLLVWHIPIILWLVIFGEAKGIQSCQAFYHLSHEFKILIVICCVYLLHLKRYRFDLNIIVEIFLTKYISRL